MAAGAKGLSGKPAAKENSSRDDVFFHIEVRPRSEFEEFRNEPVGDPVGDKGVERIDGRCAGGEWQAQAWLIGKRLAHVESGRLIPDSDEARKVLDAFDSVPEQVEGDFFRAKPSRAISDKEKNDRALKFARRLALEKSAAKKPGAR